MLYFALPPSQIKLGLSHAIGRDPDLASDLARGPDQVRTLRRHNISCRIGRGRYMHIVSIIWCPIFITLDLDQETYILQNWPGSRHVLTAHYMLSVTSNKTYLCKYGPGPGSGSVAGRKLRRQQNWLGLRYVPSCHKTLMKAPFDLFRYPYLCWNFRRIRIRITAFGQIYPAELAGVAVCTLLHPEFYKYGSASDFWIRIRIEAT